MVFTNKYTEVLMSKFPNFAGSKSLEETIDLYKDGEYVNIHSVFTGLTNYVIDELVPRHETISDEEVAIYQFVEEVCQKYGDYPEDTDEYLLDNAACTCFLENLINIASWGDISYSRFVPYLGEKSREFCRAWDEFTGVKTPGLWDEQA